MSGCIIGEIYTRDILIPKALGLKIILYPNVDDHDFIYLTKEFYKFNHKMVARRELIEQ
jgi:hypothetical protein